MHLPLLSPLFPRLYLSLSASPLSHLCNTRRGTGFQRPDMVMPAAAITVADSAALRQLVATVRVCGEQVRDKRHNNS